MITSLQTISDTSPAAASTAVGDTLTGLTRYQFLRIDASLVGATGGTLNVYLQRRLDTNVWADWVSFPQLADGAAAIKYSTLAGPNLVTADVTDFMTIGIGDDASPGVVLAAGSALGGHPGDAIRAVYVAGVGTSAGAAVVIRVTGFQIP